MIAWRKLFRSPSRSPLQAPEPSPDDPPQPGGEALPAECKVLTDEQMADWHRDGFLILKGFVDADDIERVARIVQHQWDNPGGNDHVIDLLTGPGAGTACTLSAAPAGARDEAYKLNNLFLRNGAIRRVALLPRLRRAFAELLDGEPLICNSLNFERGSQQPFHIDSWYMPPPQGGEMIAASIALDPVDGDNGPITFLPGSHLIPPYIFSTGQLNEVPAEAASCRAYLDREIERRGLREVEFRGEAGDIFVWHGQLLHGGKAIGDMARTRKSLVVHYWRVKDLGEDQYRLDPDAGYYLGYTLRGEIAP